MEAKDIAQPILGGVARANPADIPLGGEQVERISYRQLRADDVIYMENGRHTGKEVKRFRVVGNNGDWWRMIRLQDQKEIVVKIEHANIWRVETGSERRAITMEPERRTSIQSSSPDADRGSRTSEDQSAESWQGSRGRQESDRASDLSRAREREKDLRRILESDPMRVTDLVDQTRKMDEVDFTFTLDGRRVGLEFKTRETPTPAARLQNWKGNDPHGPFTLDETALRTMVLFGIHVCMVVQHVPAGRWYYLGLWDLLFLDGRRSQRTLDFDSGRHHKGKVQFDIAPFASTTAFAIDAVKAVVEHNAGWSRRIEAFVPLKQLPATTPPEAAVAHHSDETDHILLAEGFPAAEQWHEVSDGVGWHPSDFTGDVYDERFNGDW